MKIGIDISQTAYWKTGVSEYLYHLIDNLTIMDSNNTYILFFSSFREKIPDEFPLLISDKNVIIKQFRFPPTLLDILWNRLHIAPIEWFIGDIDVFISSDWTQPPTRSAKKVTILYDLIVFKYPRETDEKIVKTQKRRLEWVKKEVDIILCISESTKNDAIEILNIDPKRLKVIYPGI